MPHETAVAGHAFRDVALGTTTTGADAGAAIAAALAAYAAVVLLAAWRFRHLAMDEALADVADETRHWTTRFRLVTAGVCYAAVYVLLLRALLEIPELPRLVRNAPLVAEYFAGLPDDFFDAHFAHPVVAAFLVWVVSEGPARRADRWLRALFQRFGAIPKRIRRGMGDLLEAELTEEAAPVPEVEPEALARRWRRARSFDRLLGAWTAPGSPVKHATRPYADAIERIREDLAAIEPEFTVYREFSGVVSGARGRFSPEIRHCTRKVAEKLEGALDGLLDRQAGVLSFVLMRATPGRAGRRSLLAPHGVALREAHDWRDWVLSDVANGACLASIVMAFLYYPLVGVLLHTGLWAPDDGRVEVLLLWPLSVALIMLAGTYVPLRVQRALERLRRARRRVGERGAPVVAYLAAGAAGAAVAFGAVLLALAAAPSQPWWRAPAFAAALGGALAASVSWRLDADAEGGGLGPVVDLAAPALLVAAVGLVGSLLAFETPPGGALPEELRFVVPLCLLIGATAGGLLPARVRQEE